MRIFKFVALLLVLASLLGCQANSDETSEIIYQSVAAVQVQAQDAFKLERRFTGVVLPARSADIAFEFSGTVQYVLVNEGERVEEGDLLAQLDTSLLAIERRQLQAQLAEAEANLRLTHANLDRHESLESDGFASQQRRDELEAQRDATEASIRRLQAAVDGNEVRQQKAHLYAPFAGVIGERYLDEGSSAVPGRPALHMLETDTMEAHVGVPRQLARVLAPGQMVEVELDGATLLAEVLAVGAELKTQSHTANVRIQIPSRDVLAGSLVYLVLPDAIESPGFSLPQSSLTASMRGLWRVFVVVPAEDGLHRVEARDLQLRYSGDESAYVEGGLSDGDLVVSKGVHKLVPGQLVKVVETGEAA